MISRIKKGKFGTLLDNLRKNNNQEVISFLAFIGLTFLNADIHNDLANGVYFSLIIIIAFFIGDERMQRYFGAGITALLILVHIALWGFNPVVLVFSFLSFLIFFKNNEDIFLPGVIYLSIDSLFYYLGLNLSNMDNEIILLFNNFSEYIFVVFYEICFSLILLKIIYILDGFIVKKIKNNFLNSFGIYILFSLIFFIPIIVSVLIGENILSKFLMLIMIIFIFGFFIFFIDTKNNFGIFWILINFFIFSKIIYLI